MFADSSTCQYKKKKKNYEKEKKYNKKKITSQVSHVICHMSHVKYQMSHVSLMPTSTVTGTDHPSANTPIYAPAA